MTERRSFYKKIIYVVAMVVLFYPIYELSRPPSLDSEGKLSSGGRMAEMRKEKGLSQATLGEIDPASETAKLATLGLRGVAIVTLWNSAKHYQMVEDWMSLTAVLEQIIRLQPNFFSVWDFQAHNLSYNTSVEFDDYRDRFDWVMEGIEFFKKGVEYNTTDPRFPAKIGWFYGNKIGRADEKVQYRRLFRKQQEEKGEEPDNWLVSYDWYKKGQKLVDSGERLRVYISGHLGASQTKPGERAPSPLLFHNSIPMALISYAETLEEDGVFGDAAKRAWERAATEWRDYSKRDLASSWGYAIHLYDLEDYRNQIKNLQEKLEELLPGQFDEIKQEKLAKLPPDVRKAVEKKPADRTPEESQVAMNAEGQTKVTWEEVALRAPAAKRLKAREYATEIADLEQKANTIDTYRDIVNYNYWNERCRVEQTQACIDAREKMFEAGKAYRDGDLLKAKNLYEESFKLWDEVLKDSKILRTNSIMADDLVEEINKYKKVLGQSTGEDLPKDFILQDLIDVTEGKLPPASHEDHDHDHDHGKHDEEQGKKDQKEEKAADKNTKEKDPKDKEAGDAGQKAADKKADDKKSASDDEKSPAAKESDKKKADEKKVQEKKADDKKTDVKKSEENKTDKQTDEKTTDQNKTSDGKTADKKSN